VGGEIKLSVLPLSIIFDFLYSRIYALKVSIILKIILLPCTGITNLFSNSCKKGAIPSDHAVAKNKRTNVKIVVMPFAT
jgi:hypothetical protein